MIGSRVVGSRGSSEAVRRDDATHVKPQPHLVDRCFFASCDASTRQQVPAGRRYMAMDEPRDTPMGDADAVVPDATTALVLSEDEQRVLALYDRLRELQLQIALLGAQKDAPHDHNDDDDDDDNNNLEAARDRLLDARAAYVLRNEVIDSVLSVNPVLKAVHGATRASPIERDLLPAVEQRDDASQAVAQQAGARRAVLERHVAVAAESCRVRRQNQALAEQLHRQLAEAVEDDSAGGDKNNDTHDDELTQLQQELKASRQRWKLIKGTASAVVVGSGVDWARDPELQNLVLDPE
ncbi:hypothetical protein CMQ_4307 [Grosmannia clavigera kw1407]|uniref:Centromere protein H C-terminal domain-containing protein n=1 Tax=Grosmannia clavigera (strain kw1407 / UAMH 11150) TaxID=655863 RepID=F0XUY0_GROCL|nr:uncharacterized protein CMQ_4307 [Grosmannia clavigera kw1407]EFW98455.1 hypothetical protein CMQ_4307 [Grosmannia clavigera kw1407]